MKQRLLQWSAMNATERRPPHWLGYVVMVLMIAVVAVMLIPRLQYQTRYEIHNEDAHKQNLFISQRYFLMPLLESEPHRCIDKQCYFGNV